MMTSLLLLIVVALFITATTADSGLLFSNKLSSKLGKLDNKKLGKLDNKPNSRLSKVNGDNLGVLASTEVSAEVKSFDLVAALKLTGLFFMWYGFNAGCKLNFVEFICSL